ncbi:hypothetical protein G3N56_12495 [Desulfovibrio sulfodismutans]|uniref:DUF1640 domain-containing protein n=1 Tax=Desulfolutivibrio sulfodismutans TaxID=63561 RepID=A0A7K3NNZ0_9BACT|nr:hypothetical protein [Desulfolutivibrio sulfodismutans]NDY57553.1 hypothetical protein [Desulfolutivibrio sulfodismutans]QLA14278.1 hypothetical protein GD606_19395 [Desulfolutivibrio sulfodismutans DSM 3696]
MTLLFDDTKKLEKTLGEEAARAVIDAINGVDARTLHDLRAEVATKTDLAEVKIEIAKLDGKIDKLAMQVKLLIILALVAIAMFSPNLAELVRVAK